VPATAAPKNQLSGLARRLVADELMTDVDAQKAIESATRSKAPLVTYLVDEGIIKPRDIAEAASDEFGVPLFDLRSLDPDQLPKDLITEKLVRRHHALPLMKRGKRLYIGVSDPTNLVALDEMKFHAGMNTEAILVEENLLQNMIEKAFEDEMEEMGDLLDDDSLDGLEVAEEGGEQQDDTGGVDEAPVVRFVNKVLTDAIRKGASDIHFEPYEKTYRIRFRTDGVLYEVTAPPVQLGMRLAARIKVMSRLDVSERRVPQDGRIKLKITAKRAIDFRVSTCPTLFGEKVVMRILDPSSAKMGIDALGYEPDQKKLFMDAIMRPYGMVLVTGPTGSGKTVSLYTAVNILNQTEVNISTAEDPVEINLAGVNQVNIDEKTGMDFPKALKAFLRQDPDIILVGEIRDLETASIAVKAAQTGHLVLSTLHTNDGPQTLTRLANMGVPPFNIASSVHLIIAQRLGRRLCSNCKQPEDIPHETLTEEGFTEEQLAEGPVIYGPVGCDNCTNGYKGRVGIYQVMPISDTMGRMIMEGCNSMQLADQAEEENIPDLRKSGLRKILSGVTSLEEINRVTKD